MVFVEACLLDHRNSLFLPILKGPASSKVCACLFRDHIWRKKGLHFILIMKLIHRAGAWVRSQQWGLTLRLKLGQNFRFWEADLACLLPSRFWAHTLLTSWFGKQNCLCVSPLPLLLKETAKHFWGLQAKQEMNRFRSSVVSVSLWVLGGKTKVYRCAKSCGWGNKGTDKLHLHFRSWRPGKEALERGIKVGGAMEALQVVWDLEGKGCLAAPLQKGKWPELLYLH